MTTALNYHQKAYVCIHVFAEERPVLLVSRPDGDWCLLCGDEHVEDASEYRVVGLGHMVDQDASIEAALDLEFGWEAERSAGDHPWQKRPIPAEEPDRG